jgi:hypothetical protein
MAAWADVRKLALALPETVERVSRDGTAEWRVNDKSFVWERPLRRRDLEELGDDRVLHDVALRRVPGGSRAAGPDRTP